MNKIVVRHLLVWMGYLVFLYTIFSFGHHQHNTLSHTLRIGLGQCMVFYINFLVLIPHYFARNKLGGYVLLNFPLAVSFSLVLTVFEHHTTNILSVMDLLTHFEPLLAHSVPALLAIIGASVLYTLNQTKHRQQMKLERLKAEKNFLVQQTNPHFLFNALNNIYSLTLDNNPKGSEALLQLSRMLDYSLYGNKKERVPIEFELQYITSFSELFKLKDSSLKNIKLDFSGVDKNLSIAPLLFLPFIENAFKHSSIERDPKGYIHIEISSEGKRVQFECKNTFSERKQVDDTGGIGIANVSRRLELLYPNKHNLTVKETETTFSVSLKIQLDEV